VFSGLLGSNPTSTSTSPGGQYGIYSIDPNANSPVPTLLTTTYTFQALATQALATAISPAGDQLVISAPTAGTVGKNFSATATVTDDQGNIDTNYTGSVALLVSGGSAGGMVLGTTAEPAVNGVATFANLSATTDGYYTLMGAATGTATSDAVTINVAPLAIHFAVSANVTTVTAGQQVQVTVTAEDPANLTYVGYQGTIQLTCTDGQSGLPENYSFVAGDNGQHTFTITLKTAGKQTFSAVDTSVTSVTGTSKPIVVTPAGTHGFAVTSGGAPPISGMPFSFTVTAVDAYGNPTPSYQGTVQFSASGAPSLPPASKITGGTGKFTATLNLPGNPQTLTVTDSANGYTGAESNITVLSAATHLAITGMPSQITAGTSATITVTALDSHDQPDPYFADQLRFVFSIGLDAHVWGEPTFSGTNGMEQFTIRFTKAGTQKLTLSDLTRPNILAASPSIAVNAGALAGLSVTGFPSPALAGTAQRFTVTAVDASGNRVRKYLGTVSFGLVSQSSSLAISFLQPTVFTAADAGQQTLTGSVNIAGAWMLTANDSSNGFTGSEPIVVTTLQAQIAAAQTLSVPGQPLSFTVSAAEPNVSAGAVYTYQINWGDGSAVQHISGAGSVPVSHAYTTIGTYTVHVTVTDQTGNVSPQPATQPIEVSTAALETDPADNTKTALFVGGTQGKNTIVILPMDANGDQVSVSVNGVVLPGGPYAPTGHIVVYGNGSSDIIKEVANTINNQTVLVAIPAILFAGSGASTLSVAGSSANNILVGGAGKDTLTGGGGRDILIGGAGADTLHAGSGDDILIGGGTSYDANLRALLALMDEWGRTDASYLQRVQDLYGTTSGGLNGSTLLDADTVQADNGGNALIGGAGADWFWFHSSATASDAISGLTLGEVVTLE